MTSAALRAFLGPPSDGELQAAMTIAETILLTRRRPGDCPPAGEIGRLRSELLRAREDLELTRERLRYALAEVAELSPRLPAKVVQAAVPVDARRPKFSPVSAVDKSPE